MADSSDSFIINTVEKAPAFVAATEGYDVWLVNCRGNKYSMNHTTLNSTVDPEFWDNSWTEWGIEDLPATFRYIRNLTGLPTN